MTKDHSLFMIHNCRGDEKRISESWKLSFGQVRSLLFENALNFWFWDCTKILVCHVMGVPERKWAKIRSRKCTRILISFICHHMINLLRRPFALKFWTTRTWGESFSEKLNWTSIRMSRNCSRFCVRTVFLSSLSVMDLNIVLE